MVYQARKNGLNGDGHVVAELGVGAHELGRVEAIEPVVGGDLLPLVAILVLVGRRPVGDEEPHAVRLGDREAALRRAEEPEGCHEEVEQPGVIRSFVFSK